MSVVYTGAPRTEAATLTGFATLDVATVHEAQGRSGFMGLTDEPFGT